MNTSGVVAPPAIWVASVARLVSVSVGADTRVTLMFGYCFSNALISTVRASLAPVPDSGLADQTMLPDVVEPTLLVPPMNTSGVVAPPAIWVASVARLVSVSVGADTRVTLMFGYCFSNALISTAGAWWAPAPDGGLADQAMLPGLVDPPLLVLVPPVPGLLLELPPPQAAR